MPNPKRRRTAPASTDTVKKSSSNKQTDKKTPVRGVIRLRDTARLRRSERLKAKNATLTSISSLGNDTDSNDLREVLQEIHFLVQVYRFFDVEPSTKPCLDPCYICNDVKGVNLNESLVTLMMTEINIPAQMYDNNQDKKEEDGEEQIGTAIKAAIDNMQLLNFPPNLFEDSESDSVPLPAAKPVTPAADVLMATPSSAIRSNTNPSQGVMANSPPLQNTFAARPRVMFSGSSGRSSQTCAKIIRRFQQNMSNLRNQIRPVRTTTERRRRRRTSVQRNEPAIPQSDMPPPPSPSPSTASVISISSSTSTSTSSTDNASKSGENAKLFPDLYM